MTQHKKMGKLQHKLVNILLLTSTLPLVIIAVITVFLLNRIAVEDTRNDVGHNLAIARFVFNGVTENLRYIVRDQNRRVYTRLEAGSIGQLRADLMSLAAQKNLDFFVITDDKGRVIISVSNQAQEGRDLASDAYVQGALAGKNSASSEISFAPELKDLDLEKRASIPGVQNVEGLLIKAALPVINREEKVVGTMVAGYLLNNNKAIIDEIKRMTDLTTSIFLDDLRISSNILPLKDRPIIGTRLGSGKITQGLKRRQDYVGRISIAGSRYMSGFTPLYNSRNKVIGAIGISIPEASIFALRNHLTVIFGLSVILSIILALAFGFMKGGGIAGSIEKLRIGTEAVSKGDFQYQIDIQSKDEIEALAGFFNRMTAQLKIARRQIEEYSEFLEKKVAERTLELEAANKKLVEYERMAAMGRMAAAISHELRNVFAGIQTVTYFMKSTAMKDASKINSSLKDIEDNVIYASNIIDNVLRFSHPKKPNLIDADINFIVNNVLDAANLQETLKNSKIKLIRKLDFGIPKIKADSVQIKEVIINLVVNATQAMQKGGQLTIHTRKEAEDLIVEVEDTGSGIPEEARKNIFQPFFTTKSKGLGLGLAICKEIIEANQGKIEFSTELNKGSKFKVRFPV